MPENVLRIGGLAAIALGVGHRLAGAGVTQDLSRPLGKAANAPYFLPTP